jgi:hypothetical protein
VTGSLRLGHTGAIWSAACFEPLSRQLASPLLWTWLFGILGLDTRAKNNNFGMTLSFYGLIFLADFYG